MSEEPSFHVVELTSEYLTEHEHRAMQLTAELWNLLGEHVVANGPARPGDMRDFAAHIHAIQHAILSQAAARAYPDRYRLLGEDVG